jgi:cell division protein FtsA
MGKRRTISAIDVGTTKVCTLIGEVGDNGQMRVAGVGVVHSFG